jgi:sarcosine oxidase subunit alpha
VSLRFEGNSVAIEPGDTVASALYRAGQRIFTRSFKLHRPRGLLCCAGKCPNCLMNVDGAPNVRTCITPARDGMEVWHQNAWPSLKNDALSLTQHADFMMPPGWYYKRFTDPRVWHAVEPGIRKIAGLGEIRPNPHGIPGYEHAWMHAETAVVGGGPSGISAALAAANQGGSVVLIDDQPELGGHLRYQGNALPLEQITELKRRSNVQILAPASCFGIYEGNLLGVLQPDPHDGVAERLIHLRARRIVLASGSYETPLLFENNELVGVMLSSAVQRLIRIHRIVPGAAAVVVARANEGEEVGAYLKRAGVQLVATVEPEEMLSARGSGRVRGAATRRGRFDCDLIVVCGRRIPDAGLLMQAGASLQWSEKHGAFLPRQLPRDIEAIGHVCGEGLAAIPEAPPDSKRAFVCFCTDTTSRDIKTAIAEGFDHIETLKRYTTTTMGPCQGRMCQWNAISVCSRETGHTFDQTGVTTCPPPNPGVTLGALAGARHHPVRRTPMHYQHETRSAVWLDMGAWKRPRYYKLNETAGERESVAAEYEAVRQRVGVIDVSTLGKLDVRGGDAGKLLDKVYTHQFSDLREGRVRYGVICDETGVILDDGTVSRLAPDRYFITTTTGNLEFVYQWLEWWLVGTCWDVTITDFTAGLAAVNLAGPKARDVLRKLTSCNLESAAFPYMACREAEVAGVSSLLLRIGFVGETGWEIHYPAENGADVWNVILEAGSEFGILPFGVEAQRLLRLEKRHVIVGVDTDALTNPYEAGMAWVARLDKQDFIGKAALARAASSPAVREKLVGFLLPGKDVPEDGAAVVVEGRPAGRVTSSRYSPHRGAAIGLAFVPADKATEGGPISIRLNGQLRTANVTLQPFYDVEGARLRQ